MLLAHEQKLEGAGLIRCVRYENSHDLIPALPDRNSCSCIRNMTLQAPIFRHVGPRIKLFPHGRFEFSYEKTVVETLWQKLVHFRWTIGHQTGLLILSLTLYRYKKHFLEYHSFEEYMKRFNMFAQGGGRGLFLKDLYEKAENITRNKAGSW